MVCLKIKSTIVPTVGSLVAYPTITCSLQTKSNDGVHLLQCARGLLPIGSNMTIGCHLTGKQAGAMELNTNSGVAGILQN